MGTLSAKLRADLQALGFRPGLVHHVIDTELTEAAICTSIGKALSVVGESGGSPVAYVIQTPRVQLAYWGPLGYSPIGPHWLTTVYTTPPTGRYRRPDCIKFADGEIIAFSPSGGDVGLLAKPVRVIAIACPRKEGYDIYLQTEPPQATATGQPGLEVSERLHLT
jgi:hypothetical protein